jgi:hypothetical protein
MKKTLALLVGIFVSSLSFAATTVPVQLINPTGSTSGQAIISAGPSSPPAWGNATASSLTPQAANTVVGNATGSSASPTALPMPSCSSAGAALLYTTSSGFSCASGYVGLASPAFTGTPTAPTASLTTNTTQLATTAFVMANTVNSLQALTNETSSRAFGTSYTNSTGRPIFVYVLATATASPGGLSCLLGSVQISSAIAPSSAQGVSANFMVPNSGTYSCTGTSVSLTNWYEMR